MWRVGACLLVLLCMGLGCSLGADKGSKLKVKEEEAPQPSELDRSASRAAGPGWPKPILWMEPGDLLTSVRGTPIRAWIDNGGTPIDGSILDAVAANIELREYPSLSLINARVSIYNPRPLLSPIESSQKKGVDRVEVSNGGRGDDRAYVELAPEVELASSWHVLSLREIPAGIRLAPWTAPVPPVGRYAARFHPDSQPVPVRGILCEKSKGVWRGIVEFSENVKVVGGGVLDSIVKIDQVSTGGYCQTASEGPLAEKSARWIEQDCREFSKTEPVRVTIGVGLESIAGVPVRRFDGKFPLQQDVDISRLVESEDGCREWRF